MSASTRPCWVIYDGRAATGSTEDASVFEAFGLEDAKDNAQAIKYAKRAWCGYEFALYRYDVQGKVGRNETLIHIQRVRS